MQECNPNKTTHPLTITMSAVITLSILLQQVSQRFSPRLFQAHFTKGHEGIVRPEVCAGAYKTPENKTKQITQQRSPLSLSENYLSYFHEGYSYFLSDLANSLIKRVGLDDP